jgi:hypothetical protein
MKKSNNILVILSLILVLTLVLPPKAVQAGTIPTFSIVDVEKDLNVTVYTYNFPANKTYKVLMGEYGTLGVGGIEVTTINTGTGGSFYGTFLIPAALFGRELIAIRLQGIDTPYYSYNWFYNDPDGDCGCNTDYSGIPTFKIDSVVKDTNVTIKAYNFPKGTEFKVLMGVYGTKAINGIYVETINTGDGGNFTDTYSIPADLKGLYQIAIRLESTSGYYAYNWFYNNTTTPVEPPVTPDPGYTGIPTFFITAVVKDNSVTIKTKNFPANTDFKVTMGKMWTAGIGGTPVVTVNSGTGGEFTQTFSIPSTLYGDARISIRLEAANGYYAYNWFWNNTYP